MKSKFKILDESKGDIMEINCIYCHLRINHGDSYEEIDGYGKKIFAHENCPISNQNIKGYISFNMDFKLNFRQIQLIFNYKLQKDPHFDSKNRNDIIHFIEEFFFDKLNEMELKSKNEIEKLIKRMWKGIDNKNKQDKIMVQKLKDKFKKINDIEICKLCDENASKNGYCAFHYNEKNKSSGD